MVANNMKNCAMAKAQKIIMFSQYSNSKFLLMKI